MLAASEGCDMPSDSLKVRGTLLCFGRSLIWNI